MDSPYASPVDSNLPSRNALWVLRATLAAVAIVAWLTVLLHLALALRAEYQLAAILRQANTFAELPQVDSRELSGFVQRRLSAAGFHSARVQVVPSQTQTGKLVVQQIEASATEAVPKSLRPLCSWVGELPLVAGENSSVANDNGSKRSFFNGQR